MALEIVASKFIKEFECLPLLAKIVTKNVEIYLMARNLKQNNGFSIPEVLVLPETDIGSLFILFPLC